jgi:hypothetical protein
MSIEEVQARIKNHDATCFASYYGVNGLDVPQEEQQRKAKRGKNDVSDVFISYRVKPDKLLSQRFFDALSANGELFVWRDEQCIKDGEDWREAFVQGLMMSKNVVLLVSKGAWANFANLHANTPKKQIDNLFLEYRLALELKRKGVIKKIIPIWAGEVEEVDVGGGDPVFGDFFDFADGKLVNVPIVRDEVVAAVEAEVVAFLLQFGLGELATRPEERTVDAVVERMKRFQGPKLYTKDGEAFTFEKAVARIKQVVMSYDEEDEQEEEVVGGGGGGGLPQPPTLSRQDTANTADMKQKVALLVAWFEQHVPDIKPMNREIYAKWLYGADVTSIQRLGRTLAAEESKLKGGGKVWLLNFGITEANAEEIIEALSSVHIEGDGAADIDDAP